MGVFVVGQSKEDIPDCKNQRDVAMATKLGQNGKNQTKIVIMASVVCGTSMQFGFETGFQLSVNSSMTLSYARDKVHCESIKKGTTILSITSPNVDRFSNFFH